MPNARAQLIRRVEEIIMFDRVWCLSHCRKIINSLDDDGLASDDKNDLFIHKTASIFV